MGDSTHIRTVEYQLADGTTQTVTERLELLTTFEAYSRGAMTDARSGDLILRVGVPLYDRPKAYVFDEHTGLMFVMKVYKGVPVNGGRVSEEKDEWMLEEGEGDEDNG